MQVRARQLDVVVGRALGTVLMTVRGDLGPTTANDLAESVDEVLSEHPERVVIDLTGVGSLDARGAAALCQAKRRADRAEVQLQLTSRSPLPLAALASAGVADAFTVV